MATRRNKSISQHTFGAVAAEFFPPEPPDPLVAERTRFSADQRHRFTLFRHFRKLDPSRDVDHYCVFVGMNPSSADAAGLDATVGRCCDFAFRWGFGGLFILNVHSLRATKSSELDEFQSCLPENDYWIREIAAKAGRVVVAWGTPGAKYGRAAAVEKILLEVCPRDRVFCFKRNKDTTPIHPLYQRADAALIPYFEG